MSQHNFEAIKILMIIAIKTLKVHAEVLHRRKMVIRGKIILNFHRKALKINIQISNLAIFKQKIIKKFKSKMIKYKLIMLILNNFSNNN